MKVHTATFIASSISGISLIGCLIVIASIYSDVQTIWQELDAEIGSFRVATDDLWRDIMSLGHKKRLRRQYDSTPIESQHNRPSSSGNAPGIPRGSQPPGIQVGKFGGPGCNCQVDNKCPRGPAGPKGFPGRSGLDGHDGLDGIPGVPGHDYAPEHAASSACFNCPAGIQGPPGPNGRPGQRGLPGRDGRNGMSGHDGQPGSPGEQGPPGPHGPLGNLGFPGEKGNDADKPIGRPGPKGQQGPAGGEGPQGNSGHDGHVGEQGPKGPEGPKGPRGPQGEPGRHGEEGDYGRPGHDAEYCPCPHRGGQNAGVGGSGGEGYGTRV
uniref:Nematode cuticle collagen N-terminal domain-containing protein n=1 Tax=Acrobeloides nanus TaxID=290746 RepID=A0A914E204_9BILA